MKFFVMVQERMKSISRTWIRFPVVFILLCSIAVFASMSMETGIDHSREIFSLILGVFLSMVMSVGFEKRSNPLMWLAASQFVAAGLAAAYYFFVLTGSVDNAAVGLRILILCFALLFVFLWVPCLRWKTDFNELFMSLFKAFFTTLFFMAIIWGGVSLVLRAVDMLLFRLPVNLFGHVSVWIWIFFAPMLLLSLIPVFGGTQEDTEKQEHLARIPAFFKVLLSYVLIPLTGLYTLVLLAYLVKTLAGGDQGNLLLPLILTYCIVVITLYILVSGIDNKISVMFRMTGPKFMLVIALYQVVNLISRIPDEGIVYGRYFVILFGIFSVAAGVLLSFLPLRKNFVLAIVLTCFALVSVTPPVDAFTVSTRSQTGILENVLTSNDMLKNGSIVPNKNVSEKDQGKVTTAMQYLYDVKETDKVPGVPANFDLYSDFQNTFGFSMYYQSTTAEPVQTTSHYYSLDSSKPIELGSYQYLITVSTGKYDSNATETAAATVTAQGETYNVVIAAKDGALDLQLKDSQGSILVTASLSGMIDGMTSNGDPGSNETVSPDKMTFDASGKKASMRIVFQYASSNDDGSRKTYDANMYLLIRFE